MALALVRQRVAGSERQGAAWEASLLEWAEP
jgi:hypothetical protein